MTTPLASVGIGSAPRTTEDEASASGRDLATINSSTRIPALDGLRGVAILLVLLHHSVFQVPVGSGLLSRVLIAGRLSWSGVDLFFVLSGFLIGGILLDVRDSPRYFKTFYFRRAYRILPLYAVVCTLYALRFVPGIETSFGFAPATVGSYSWLSYVTFTQNVLMASMGTFAAAPVAATWSLAVEEQFYLTMPLLVRKFGRYRLTLVLIALVVAAPLLRAVLHFHFRNGDFAACVLTPCRADALSLGVLCALLARSPRAWRFLLANRTTLMVFTGLLFLGLVPMTLYGNAHNTGMTILGYSWLAFSYAGFLLVAVSGTGGLTQHVLSNRVLMELGTLAYCAYLIHVPLIEVSRRLVEPRFSAPSPTGRILAGLMGVLLSLLTAKLSWTFFEKPLLRQGHAHKY